MILSRIRILPQERFDLEDLNGMLSAARTDSKYQVKKLLSNLNYVVNGFQVTGIGLKAATVNMTDGTLIIPQNSNDFSWYTTSPTDPNVTIPDASLVDGARNYIEMELLTENNTSVTRAFWDPEANGGSGLEFNQIVDTITDLTIQFVVLQGGFSGSPDRLPLAIIDCDGSGTIKQILDERVLYHRLGTPDNPHATFAWGTKEEPPYTMNLTGVTGMFVAGETINIGSQIATVLNGGTTTISFQLPSSKDFHPGDSVSGLTSGATGTIDTVAESFTGVDKSVINLKQDLDAIKTEILLLKTNSPNGFWWQTGTSITELVASIAAINATLTSASYDEDELVVTGASSGVIIEQIAVDTDIMTTVNTGQPTPANQLGFWFTATQNGTLTDVQFRLGSNTLTFNADLIAYCYADNSGAPGTLLGSSNATTVSITPTKTNFDVSFTSAINMVAGQIYYITLGINSTSGFDSVIIWGDHGSSSSGSTAGEVSTSNGGSTWSVGGAGSTFCPYFILNGTIGGSAGAGQILGPIASGTVITIPKNSRISGTPQQFYTVGKGALEIFLNGQRLSQNEAGGWSEIGASGSASDTITIQQNLVVGDYIAFRLGLGGAGSGSGGGGSGAADDNFFTLPASATADNADYLLIYDVSIAAYRKQLRSIFLAGLGSNRGVQTFSGNHTVDSNADDICLMNVGSSNKTFTLPDPTTCGGKQLTFKKIDSGLFSMIISGAGFPIDGQSSITTSTQWQSVTLVADAAGAQWVSI